VSDITTGLPIPGSMFDVSTVSLTESFSPLFGIDMTFLNSLTAKFEIRKTRSMILSMTSQQLTEDYADDIVIGFGYKINNFKLFTPKRTIKSTKRKTTKSNDDKDKTKSKSSTNNSRGFSNDLNLKLDITFRDKTAVSRDIKTELSQATSGTKTMQISFSAEYTLSRYLSLTAYYDRQMNTPLMTSSSYPITTQDFGVSLKFSLTR